jgi:hypothetical protein
MPELYLPDFSYDDYQTYTIQEGDTPDSVAEKLGIDVYNLRSNHNRHCPLKDAIGPTFPRHLKRLIIKPPKVELRDEEKELHRKNVVFNDGFGKLSLNYSHGENTYGILCTIENGAEICTLKQEINVTWLAQNQGYHFYRIIRDANIFINDTIAHTMGEKIAQQAAQVLYPLTIVVNENGEWVDIYNFKEIEERWRDVKDQIRKYYKGKFVEKYFSIQDKNLENSETLYLTINRDWFLNTLFNGIHIQYPADLILEKEIDFPFIAKSDTIKYRVKQKADPLLDTDNLIVVDINGQLDDLRSKTDFENELKLPVKEYSEEKPTGNYRAKYFLNPNTYMPEAFTVSCDLALDTPQKYSITATNLHTVKEMVIASRESTFVGVTKTKQSSGNSFWFWFISILIFCGIIYVSIKYYNYKFR